MSDIGARFSISAHLDEGSINNISKKVQDTLKTLEKNNKLKIDIADIDKLDSAIKSLGKNAEKIDLDSFIRDFLKDLREISNADEQIDKFRKLISSIETLGKINIPLNIKNLTTDELKQWLDVISQIKNAKKDISDISSEGDFDSILDDLDSINLEKIKKNGQGLLEYIELYKSLKKKYKELKSPTEDQKLAYDGWVLDFKESLAENNLAKIINKNVDDALNGKLEIKAKIKPEITNDVSPNDIKKAKEKVDETISKNSSKVKMIPDFEDFNSEVEKGLEKFSFSKGIKITPLSDSNNGSDDIPLDDTKISDEASKSEISSVDSVKEHVKELAEEIGTKKVEAINNEVTAMENAATSEIESINKIKDAIDQLISKIQSINTTAGSPLKDVLDNISASLTTINGLSSIPNVFNSIVKTANSSQQIGSLKIVLEAIATSLEQIDKNASGNGFLKQLSSLTAQQKQLETLLKLAQNVNAVNQVAKNINTKNNSSKNKTDQQLINEYYDERVKALRDQNKYLKKLENQNLSPDKTQKYNDLLSDAKKRERNSVRKINRLNSNVSPTGKRSERVTDLEEQIKIQKDLNNISAQDVKNKAQQDAAAKKQADDIKDLNKWYTEEISNLDQIIKLRKKLADNSLSKLDRQQTNDKIKTLTSRNAVLEKNIKKSNYTDPDAQNNLDAKKQEVRIEQVSGWYKQLISNLQRILKLKKEIDNSPNLTPFEIDQKKKEINNLQKKNPTLSRNINSAVSKDPSLFDRNSDILILDLKNEITLQKQRTAQSKAAQQQAEAEAKANQEVADSYDALIQGLRKIKSLENAKSKTDNPYEIDTYNKAIDDIDEATLRANLQKAESNKNVTGNFDAQKKVVADLEKDINRIGKLAQDKIDQANDELQKNHVETKQILKEDEADWSRAMDLLTNNSYFKEATRDANEYYDILKSIVSIERVDERDNKTGQHSIFYRFKDTEGNQLKVGADGTFEIERKQILDLADAYNIITKAENELNVKRLKNKTENSDQIELYNKLKDELQQIYKLTGGTDSLGKFQPQTEQEAEAFQNLANSIKKTVIELGNLTAAQKGTTQTQIEKFLRKIYNWEDKNTKGTAIFKTELDGLIKETQNLGADVDLDKQIGKFVALQNAVSSQGADGLKFFDEFKKNAKLSLSNLLAQYLSLQDLIRYVQSAITQINDLDYALVDLSKTADMTEDQLNDFYMSAHNSAKELGTTTKNIIDLASSWSRLGYNTNEEATKMAELTAKFAAISPGMTTDEASTGLINIQKSWQKTLKVQDLEAEVLDKVNVLGNNFAEENSDILNGMQKAASALSAMGTSYEDAFALFTGAQEVIQDADRVGNGLKTVAMRIRGYSEDVETGSFVIDDSLKNISGKLIDLTKIAGVLPEGISVYTDETKNLPEAEKKYKSLLEYLREISKYWDKFSETQQTELLQALFAKTQASVGSAILQNFDQVEAALQAMEDSEGSADREMSKIEDSISYKINAIQQTWVGFLQQLANRDVIKGAADALLSLSEGITSLGPVGVVTGIGALTAGIKALGKATDSNGEKIFSFGKKVRDALGVTTLQQSYMGGYADSLKKMTKEMIEASLSSSQYNKTQKEQLLAMAGLYNANKVQLSQQEETDAQNLITLLTNQNLINSEKDITDEILARAASELKLTDVQVDLLKKKSLSINIDKQQVGVLKTLKTNIGNYIKSYGLLSLAITGATMATVAIINEIKKEKSHIEDVRKEVDELTKSYTDNLSTVKSNTSDVRKMYEEYSKLAKNVDSLGNNKGLSDENFERYNELTDQIADKMPTLVSGWTNQNHAILKCKDSVEALNKEIDNQNLEAYRQILIGNDDTDADSIMENYQNTINGWNGFWLGHIKGSEEKDNNLDFILQKTDELQNEFKKLEESEGIEIKDFVKYANSMHLFADKTFSPVIDKVRSLQFLMNGAGLKSDVLKIDKNTIQSWSDLDRAISDVHEQVSSAKTTLKAEVDSAVSGVQKVADAYLHVYSKNKKTFSDLSNDAAASISTIIQSLDSDTIDKLGLAEKPRLESFINSTVDLMLNNPDIGNAITGLFTVDKSQPIKVAQETANIYLSALKKALEEGDISQDLYDLLVGQTGWIDETAQTLNNAIKGALTSNPELEKAQLASYKQTAEEKSRTYVNQDLIDDQEYINDLKQEIEELKSERDKAKEERKKKYSTPDMVGNINLNDRPTVSGVDMNKAGWGGNSQTYSTVMTDGEFFDNPKDGTPWYVQYTPILPNGEVLTKQSCMDYIQNITEDASSAEDVLARDSVSNGGEGILFGVFDSYTDKNGNVNKLQWDVNTEQAREIFQNEGEDRHNNQADIYDKEGAAVEELTQRTLELDAAQKKYNEDLKNSSNGSDYYSQKLKEQESVVHDRTSAENVLQDYMNSLDSAQEQQDFATYLNNLDKTISTAKEAKEVIRAFKAETAEKSEAFNLTDFSSTITQLEKIHTLYNTFAEKAENGKSGLDLAADIKDVEALRAEFEGLDDVDFGNFKTFDNIARTLTSGKSSAEEMQSAFDQLSTSLVDATLKTGDFDAASQQVAVTQLKNIGYTEESAKAYVENAVAMENARKNLADVDITSMTVDEITELANEAGQFDTTAAAILQFYLEKLQANGVEVLTSGDIANIEALCGTLQIGIENLAAFQRAKQLALMSDEIASNPLKYAGRTANIQKAQQDLKNQSIQEILAETRDKTNSNLKNRNTSTGSKNSGGGGGSSKSDTDEYLEKYKTQYERLKKYRDDDKISEYDYLQYLRALYENYFKDKKKYAEQYEEYEHEYLEGMKTLYENVFTYLSGRIDKQISKLNDAKSKAGSAIDAQKTAATDSLKAQKKAAVDAIEAQIKAIKKQQDVIQNQVDAYQEQIDAINDANDAREREIALQKALYDLDKLQNQRTNLVYSESQGMHYEADLSGIRDARDSVDDAKNDIEIANIQKKIDLLEKQKDLLDDEIDKLEEQKDAIEDYYDNLIDETEAYYDKLKEDMEAAYDKQIELLEKQKDKFSDLKDFVDNIDIASALHRLTGEDTNQILQDLMNGNFDAIDKLISGYMDYVGKLKEGNQDFLNGMKDLAGIDVKALTDPIEATSKAFEGIDKASIDITESLDSMVSAFADLPNKIDVANLFGDNSAVTAKIKESGTKLGEEYIGNLSTFLYSDEAKSKIDIGKLFENIGSDVNMTSAAEAIGEPFIEAAKAKITELANQPATAEAIADAVKNATVTGTTTGVTTAMSSEEVSSAVSTGIDTIANTISQDGKSAESFKTLGQSLGQAIGEGLNAAFSEDSTSDSANTFVTTFCDKIKEAFAGNNIADILGVGDNNVFEQFIASLTAVIDQLGDIDTTPLVNLTSQFQDLQKAATDTASAIGGNGTTAQTMPTTGENGEANGTGNQNAAATTTGNSDSLVGAITALGSTADEVLGEGGEDGDGSGIVGQFQAMQKAVEDTAIAIGSGDSEGSGKKGGDDSGVGLIAALEAEKEVTFDEEQGLPKQIELWGQLEGGIQNCVDAVQRLIDGLSQLEEFSLSVNFAGFSVPAGAELGSEATGTVTFGGYAFADGTNVGLESDQRALVGEVGEESLVRNGRFSLIGRNGAQFMDLKKGDIIFSHSQTKQLLKTGRINGRGKTVGNHAYADGTPLNKAFKFAGQDTTASNLSKFSAMLTGFVDTTNAAIEPISKVVQSIAKSVPNVSNSTSAQNMAISIGDIHLSGVQNPDGLAQAIKSYLPGKLLQELHK